MHYSEIIIDNQYHDFNPVVFGHENCEPGHGYGPAIRTHWLLHYVISGYGQFTREGQTYKVGPGQIFVIPPYLKTYYEADKKNPWHYIWIGFTTDSPLDLLSQPVINCRNAGPVFQEMLLCSNLKNGRSAYLASCIWKLVSLLLENSKYTPGYIDEALHCMHSEYATGITIQQIADRLRLNRSYFFTIFKKHVGVSPSEYLIHLRLEKAEELMRVFGETPSVAATSVGYEDLYHFSKTFKEHYGMSPREYAKNAKGIQ